MTGADDVVAGVVANWTAAFGTLNAEAMSRLYSKHALFFGSNPTLYRGREGVASYFRGLPRWQSQSVRFTDVVAEQVNSDLVNFAGIANFSFDGKSLSVKMTWVIGREDGDWKIVSHHASSKAPLI